MYIYNNNFYFKWFLNEVDFLINKSSNIITITFKQIGLKSNYVKNQLKLLNYSLTSYFLKKIKIAGKSYRIEKIGYGFNLTVGHTLNTYISIKNIIQRQTTKHKLVFFFINKKKTQNNFYKIIYLRLWDVYTQRGLRFGKHKLFKKQGKKSTYV